MTDYTATVYGVADSRKGKNRSTNALGENADPNKGQKCMRFSVAAENEIMGGEIWVNEDTVVAAADTFTLTVTADA